MPAAEQHSGLDIIGDVHGHADALILLLDALGYREVGGIFSHPSRQAVFVGDFIDKGPRVLETLRIVRAMVDNGSALAVMGNHEFNAIAYHTEDPEKPESFFREHNQKNYGQHMATLDQVAASELAEYIEWFKELPVYLDESGIRIVHACWDPKGLQTIDKALRKYGRFTPEFLRAALRKKTKLYAAIENVLKGPEAELPNGMSFTDPYGKERRHVRIRWFEEPAGRPIREYALPSNDVYPVDPAPDEWTKLAKPYSPDDLPVFFGHYWLKPAKPELLAHNVACLDYSIANKGLLCAYRWDGSELNANRFLCTSALPFADEYQECRFISPAVVHRAIGAVPALVFAAASYALYLCSALWFLRETLVRGDDVSKVATAQLGRAARIARHVIDRFGPIAVRSRVDSFSLNGFGAPTAHGTSVELAIEAYTRLLLDTGDFESLTSRLSAVDFEYLRREIQSEAGHVAGQSPKVREQDVESIGQFIEVDGIRIADLVTLNAVDGDADAILEQDGKNFLRLSVDVENRTVRRYQRLAEFNNLGRAWKLFKHLYDAEDAGLSRHELYRMIWGKNVVDENVVEENNLDQQKRKVNGLLEPLGVEIGQDKGSDELPVWRLMEIRSPFSPTSGD